LNAFSAIGVDHAHEQNNAAVKSTGGAIGLTQDPSALRRWTIAGPEVTRLLSEFEGKKEKQPGQHHEMYPKFQRNFFERCAALKDSFLQNENPFLVKGCDLLTIDTRTVVKETGIESLNNLERHGMEMLQNFVQKRLETHDVPFYDPVKKQKFQIFTHQKPVKTSLTIELKTDLQLFSRLFIVSLSRSLDLGHFFEHENQTCPPALSANGDLRSGQKNELVQILEKFVENERK